MFRGSLAIAVALLACSSGNGDATLPTDTDAATAADSSTNGAGDAPIETAPETPIVSPYPSGHYGYQAGDVIPNIALAGYPRQLTTGLANAVAFTRVSMADLRTAARHAYLVIHTSGFL